MAGTLLKRWIVKAIDDSLVAQHAAALNVSFLLARLIALRGYLDLIQARSFLSSSLRNDLPSPFIMADMEPAVLRVVEALQNGEQIAVWGDYDVDGTTGASVLVTFLRAIGAAPIYHVPHRIEEGYGLNIDGLRGLKERGVDLVITIDCGISNAREVESAAVLGLDVIVIDHHQPPDELPPAVAVINPHRHDCSFPDKGLCAAGLAFYFVIGLRARLRDENFFAGRDVPDVRHFLDIVTLGTIADMVPLRGVNRTLIRRGLLELANSSRPGVLALKQVAEIPSGEVSAGQVGFRLGPRINAAGRVDYGIKVVELLTTESAEVATRIARELDEHNRERRTLEAEVLQRALQQAEALIAEAPRCSLVLAGEGWHPGVLGIVASRIVERFYRPTVVIGINGGDGKGSARSIKGFHMVEGLRQGADHLEKFGGHEYAGGLSIAPGKVPAFAATFEQAARAVLSDDALVPLLEIDATLSFDQVTMAWMRELDALKPFGVGNAEPVFMTSGTEVCERRPFSAGVRYRLKQAGRVLSAVYFGAMEETPGQVGDLVDVVYRLTENHWNGTTTVELRLADCRLTEPRSLRRNASVAESGALGTH